MRALTGGSSLLGLARVAELGLGKRCPNPPGQGVELCAVPGVGSSGFGPDQGRQLQIVDRGRLQGVEQALTGQLTPPAC